MSLEEIINTTDKTWIYTRYKELRAYSYIPGKENAPLFVFLMGLGGSIEETLYKNKVIKGHIKNGHPVLILEGSKQGDSGLVANLRNFKSNFEINMHGFEDLFKVFMSKTLLEFPSLVIAGHSYGAYGASYLMSKIEPQISPRTSITLQLMAPAVTNFNNRLNPEWLNKKLEDIVKYMDLFSSNSGYRLQVKQVANAMISMFPKLQKDKVKLEMASELTVDAGKEHVFNFLKDLSPRVKIQLILGAEERLMFPMMHWELYQSLIESNKPVILLRVEETDHYVPEILTEPQVLAILEHSAGGPLDISHPYFSINSKGETTPLPLTELISSLQESSRDTWDNFVKMMESSSAGTLPIVRQMRPNYPSEWTPNQLTQ